VVAVVSIGAAAEPESASAAAAVDQVYRTVTQLRAAAEASGYQVEKLLEMAQA
jgi:hypothetical protein